MNACGGRIIVVVSAIKSTAAVDKVISGAPVKFLRDRAIIRTGDKVVKVRAGYLGYATEGIGTDGRGIAAGRPVGSSES